MPVRYLALAAVSALLLLPSPAHAGVVTLAEDPSFREDGGGRAITYVAATGERNDLRIAFGADGNDVVTDTAGVVAGAGCVQISPTRATCREEEGGDDGVPARIALGDQADRLVLEGISLRSANATLPVRADGAAGADSMSGSGESDVLRGGSGNDTLRGGGGDDELTGAGGRDVLEGGAGSDTVSYGSYRRGVRADLDGRADDGARGERDRIHRDVENLDGGRGRDRLTGNRRDNVLDGGAGGDRLTGGTGSDIVFGRSGRDRLRGGPGADSLDGGSGRDRLVARDGRTDTVDCGGGRDRASIDSADDVISCEGLGRRRRASATIVPVNDEEVPGGIEQTLEYSRSTLTGQPATIYVACPRAVQRRCRGELRIMLRGRRIGRRRFDIRGGRRRLVSVRITKAGFQTLGDDEFAVTVELRTRVGGRRILKRSGFLTLAGLPE